MLACPELYNTFAWHDVYPEEILKTIPDWFCRSDYNNYCPHLVIKNLTQAIIDQETKRKIHNEEYCGLDIHNTYPDFDQKELSYARDHSDSDSDNDEQEVYENFYPDNFWRAERGLVLGFLMYSSMVEKAVIKHFLSSPFSLLPPRDESLNFKLFVLGPRGTYCNGNLDECKCPRCRSITWYMFDYLLVESEKNHDILDQRLKIIEERRKQTDPINEYRRDFLFFMRYTKSRVQKAFLEYNVFKRVLSFLNTNGQMWFPKN